MVRKFWRNYKAVNYQIDITREWHVSIGYDLRSWMVGFSWYQLSKDFGLASVCLLPFHIIFTRSSRRG